MYIYICVQGYMVDPQTRFRLKIVFLQPTTFCLYFLPPLCFQSNNFTVLKMELQSLMVVMLFKNESTSNKLDSKCLGFTSNSISTPREMESFSLASKHLLVLSPFGFCLLLTKFLPQCMCFVGSMTPFNAV